MTTDPTTPATVAACLQVQGDLHPDEYERLLDHWTKLDTRLRSFRDDTVELHLWVKERDTRGQHVTLEAKIAHLAPMVATSSDPDIDRALLEVRDELVRRLGDSKNRAEPRNNRGLRDTTRH